MLVPIDGALSPKSMRAARSNVEFDGRGRGGPISARPPLLCYAWSRAAASLQACWSTPDGLSGRRTEWRRRTGGGGGGGVERAASRSALASLSVEAAGGMVEAGLLVDGWWVLCVRVLGGELVWA